MSVMASNEILPDLKIPYGVDGSEAHLVAGHGLSDRRGSVEGLFATLVCTVTALFSKYFYIFAENVMKICVQ